MQRRSIVRVIALCAAIGVSSAVMVGVWFVAGHRDTYPASASAATVEFEQLRARFAGTQPLIDMRLRRPADGPQTTRVSAPLLAFHTAIFDTRGGERVVRMTMPYWLGRRYARHAGNFKWLGELTFLDDTEFDPEQIQLSLDQIERHGPGLLVDYQHPGGGQFMAWVE